MIGIIADFWRGRETLPTVYWNNSPMRAAEATDATDAVGSIAASWANLLSISAPPPPPARLRRSGAAAAGAWARFSISMRSRTFASAGAIPSSYNCGFKLAYNSGRTTGRGMYSGWYRSWMNEIGRPLTRESWTLFQSLSVWFSTMAQP